MSQDAHEDDAIDADYNSKVSEKLTSKTQINQWSESEVAQFDKHLDESTNGGSGWVGYF
jgi:hypothetical protein